MSTTPDIKVRGIRGPIPSGYLLGRTDAGTGPVHLVSMTVAADAIASQGSSAPGGGGGGGLPSIADGDMLANETGGSAAPSATTLTAFLDYLFSAIEGDVLYRNATVWTVRQGHTFGLLPLITNDTPPAIITTPEGNCIGVPQ